MGTKLLHSYTCLPARQVARLLKKKQYNNLTIYQSKRAFTLIELLVVIALIAIIAGIISTAYISSQQKGRDAQRKSDLAQVKKALDAAKNDCLAGTWYPFGNIFDVTSPTLAFTDVTNDLKSANYLTTTFQDPKNNNGYVYEYHPDTSYTYATNPCSSLTSVSGTKTFLLRAKLEFSLDSDSAKSYTNCQNIITNIVAQFNPTPSSGDGYYYICND